MMLDVTDHTGATRRIDCRRRELSLSDAPGSLIYMCSSSAVPKSYDIPDGAAALGVSALRKNDWSDTIALGTELEIQVREPATSHRLAVGQIQRWCDGVVVSPDEILKKGRLRQLLA